MMVKIIYTILMGMIYGGRCTTREKIINIPGFNPIPCTGERTFSCRHVPYAEYPFRFEPAKPIRPWMNYTLDHYLTMDIFTKKLNEEKPVIVALLQENLGEFEHTNVPRIMLKKVVFISLRYRSGLYGFLSTNTPEIRGNEALFDIITALQWIQEYIYYFGGNADKVTLMGLEDSGALVHALAISPATPKDLFQNIIIGETTAFTPRLVTNVPLKDAFEISNDAGCNPLDTINDLNECLLNAGNNLGKITRKCSFKEKKRTNFSPIKLSTGDLSTILPEDPLILARNSRKHYPALLGTSQNIMKQYFENFVSEEDFVNFIPHLDRIIEDAKTLIKYFSDPHSEDIWLEMVRYQVANMTGNFSNRIIYMTVLQDLIGILDSKYPLFEAAKYNSPTYLYVFNYNLFTLHCNQLGFMDLDTYESGSLEDKAFRSLIKIWTTFAETNEPPLSMPKMYENWIAVGNYSYPYLRLSKYPYVGKKFSNEFIRLEGNDSEESDEDLD